jgi:hypothetical protein
MAYCVRRELADSTAKNRTDADMGRVRQGRRPAAEPAGLGPDPQLLPIPPARASGCSLFPTSAPNRLVLMDSLGNVPEDVQTRCLGIVGHKPSEDRLRTKFLHRLTLCVHDVRLAEPKHSRHAGDENDAKQSRCQVGIERRDKALKKR